MKRELVGDADNEDNGNRSDTRKQTFVKDVCVCGTSTSFGKGNIFT